MNQELKSIINNISKKPLARKIAGGFLFAIFLLAIWFAYGFEIVETKTMELDDSVQGRIAAEFLNKDSGAMVFKIFDRGDYAIIKSKNKQASLKDIIMSPLILREEKCYAKNYFLTSDGIAIQNINLKDLILDYERLTGQSLIDIFGSDVLSNNFSSGLKEKIVNIFSKKSNVEINLKDGKFYYRAIIDAGGEIEDKITDFEKSVGSTLSIFYPEEREMILPDDSKAIELFANPDTFSFQENEKGVRYIKDEKSGFALGYSLSDGKFFLSNDLENLDKKVSFFEECNGEGVVIVPAELLGDKIISNNYLEKYKTAIFIQDRNKEVKIILK